HYYYQALLYETLGDYTEARAEWALYAAIEDAPWRRRALEHIRAIDAQRSARPHGSKDGEMMMKRSLLIVVMAGATADASVWDRALTSPEDEAARDLYDAKMLEGDTATLTSTIQSASIRNGLESIKRAEAAYRTAASIRPREGEPYFRIGNLLYQTHFDCDTMTSRLPTCDPMYATPRRAELIVEAWDEFEKRAPLDPRVGEILLKRAILNT